MLRLLVSVLSSTTFATSLRVAKLRKPSFRTIDIAAQKVIERKMAIQGHVFWGQWKGTNTIVLLGLIVLLGVFFII